MSTEFDQVVASYHRARRSGKLFDTFYDLFLAKSPELPPMFARTDFAHQKRMLRESILELLLYAQMQSDNAEIERLAQRHRELAIKKEHFELWLEALCEALTQHDPEFTSQLESQWRDTLRPGLDVMLQRAGE